MMTYENVFRKVQWHIKMQNSWEPPQTVEAKRMQDRNQQHLLVKAQVV